MEDEIITGTCGDDSINTGDLNKNISEKAGSGLLSQCAVCDDIAYN